MSVLQRHLESAEVRNGSTVALRPSTRRSSRALRLARFAATSSARRHPPAGLWEASRSGRPGAARASALQHHARGDCLNGARLRAQRVSPRRPRTEHRRGVGPPGPTASVRPDGGCLLARTLGLAHEFPSRQHGALAATIGSLAPNIGVLATNIGSLAPSIGVLAGTFGVLARSGNVAGQTGSLGGLREAADVATLGAGMKSKDADPARIGAVD